MRSPRLASTPTIPAVGAQTRARAHRPPAAARGAAQQSTNRPDAAVIDPQDRGRDGRRYVIACGTGHLQALIDRARRDCLAEQLWFGQLCRVSTLPAMRGVLVSNLGRRTGLSPDQLRRAVDWNARCNAPRVTLPGGQRLLLRARR